MTKFNEPLIGRREHGQIPVYDYPIDFNGRWVVRDRNGKYIDHDKYRHDLASRLPTEIEIEFIEGDKS